MGQYINKCLYCTVICFLIVAIANSGECKIQSQEWKLQVNPEIFNADREAGYRLLADRLTAAASSAALTANFADAKEKCRSIRYFDTVNRDLARQHYILRQRVRVKKGIVQEYGDLTIKLRQTKEDQAAIQVFERTLAEYAKVKVEADTLGFIDRQAGKSQTLVSISATRKSVPVMDRLSAEATRAYFPHLPVDITDELSVVGQSLEYSKTLGELTNESQNALAVDIAIWYDPVTEQSLLAELSWKANADSAAANQLFIAMQEGNQDILMAGQAKTAMLAE